MMSFHGVSTALEEVPDNRHPIGVEGGVSYRSQSPDCMDDFDRLLGRKALFVDVSGPPRRKPAIKGLLHRADEAFLDQRAGDVGAAKGRVSANLQDPIVADPASLPGELLDHEPSPIQPCAPKTLQPALEIRIVMIEGVGQQMNVDSAEFRRQLDAGNDQD